MPVWIFSFCLLHCSSYYFLLCFALVSVASSHVLFLSCSISLHAMCSGQRSVLLLLLRNLSTGSALFPVSLMGLISHIFCQVSRSIPQPAAAPTQWKKSRKASRITTPLLSVGQRFSLQTMRPRLNTDHPGPLWPSRRHSHRIQTSYCHVVSADGWAVQSLKHL